MGLCISLNKDSESAGEKHRLWSKNEKLAVMPSPVKEKVNAGALTVSDVINKSPMPSARFSGSRDEAFFDSQPWLESDCEDDFVSVNGDFTPSRGSTPVDHSFSVQVNKPQMTPLVLEKNDSSPPHDDLSTPDNKKRLSELFKESLRTDEPIKEEYAKAENKDLVPLKAKAKSANGTPFLQSGTNSVMSSERTPNGVIVTEDGSAVKSSHCCLPRLVSNRSFTEKKKGGSPAHSVG